MSNMRIIEIPASMRESAGRKNTVRKLRVAAYCRVSTEEEEQQGSFEIQKLYYTEKINSTPEWEVAGIYADDGISGVHTKKRDGFNQMIQDCKKRKIDLILTKSISRFARNTLDSIQYVRMLKQMGIAVVFEKENINTATMNSEMILTVLSAFAQAESESISQNVARGKRMGYKHGKFAFPYGRIIGYRKGADGKPEIIPEQAEIIRLIFNSYLQGDSLQSIKAKLETAGALTARGNTEWSAQSIQRILQNEKYCGDVLLQKTFTEDVLTGVHKKNTGQLPQYYIENYHEGIVSKQMFREVQTEIARRNSKSAANQRKRRRGRYNSKYALSERLVCGNCGSPYKRVTWNIHGRKQIVWRCVNRIEYGTKFCGSSPSVPEEELHRAILKAVQDLAANFTDEVAAQINGILHDIQTGESAKPKLGWVGTYLPLIVPYFFAIQGFFVYLILNFIDGIPKDLDEAARIDGCSYFGIYLRIILPLIVPALITAGIFSFMWRWDDFLSALLYVKESVRYPASLALKLFCDPGSSSDYGAMFAMSTLSIIPAVTIFIVFQKYLVEGIATSGLKG